MHFYLALLVHFRSALNTSMQCYSMMQELARRGMQVASISGGIFDNPSGVARIPNLAEQIAQNEGKKLLVNKDYSAGGGG